MSNHVQVAVIGCGVAGAAIAYELSLRGIEVTVCFRSDDDGSSAKNHKWLHSGLLYPSEPFAKRMWDAFRSDSEFKEPHIVGSNRALFTALNEATLAARLTSWENWDIGAREFVETVSPGRFSALARQERALSGTSCQSGIYTPDCVIDFIGLVRTLRRRAEAKGARFVEGAAVLRIEQAKGSVTGILYQKGQDRVTLGCDYCVIAAGAWSLDLVDQIEIDVPLELKKCVILEYQGELVSQSVICLDIRKADGSVSDVALVPFRGRTYAAGTSFELVSDPDDLSFSERDVTALVAELTQGFPALGELPFETQVCVKTEGIREDHPDVDLKVFGSTATDSAHGFGGVTVAIPGKASLMFLLARAVADNLQASGCIKA